MINLRYHIVSITAVFLALGIGLAFGAAFIDRATVDQLDRNLGEIEAQNDSLEQRVGEQSAALAAAGDLEQRLREEGLTILLDRMLQDVPVLVLASAGVDGDLLTDLEAALVGAGARVPGILRITDRVALDDQGELDDLRDILELPTAEASQLRTAAVRQVRRILADASVPDAPVVPEGSAATPAPMPALVADLLEAGFLDLDPADAPPAEFALVPDHGLRILAVSGDGADARDDDFLRPLLTGMAEPNPTEPGAPAPVIVAAQPSLPPEIDGDDAAVERADFVAPLRADEVIRARLSTVDGVDTFAGMVAAVLALQHGAVAQVGHYGLGEGAQSLLPAPVEERGDGDEGGG